MKYNLKNDINSVLNIYPKLKLIDEDKNNTITGYIDIFDSDDNYCDSFRVKLSIPNDYPNSFPKLYEIEGKIKTIDSSHINQDGSCCVCSLQEEDRRLKGKSISIEQYLKEFAIPFLANIIYYRENGEYANGEYKHGIEGIIQYYQELFNRKNANEILTDITESITKKSNRNDKCFCNSGLKYKKCHLLFKKELGKLSQKRLLTDYKLIKHHLQNKNGNNK